MDIILFLLLMALAFLFYMLIRNNMVYKTRREFMEFFYHHDPNGYDAGNKFHDQVPSYDEMLFRFWVSR